MSHIGGVFRGTKNTGVGLKTTLRSFLGRNITEQYPEVKHAVMPRFRGRHKLHLHANGLEKCVGCSLCAAACPADCIRVVAAENTDDNRVSAGERYAQVYEINMSRCIFCGYCEMACPFDAITLGNDWELADLNRDQMVYTKDMLLADPPTRDEHGMNRRAVTREDAGFDSATPVWLEETVRREFERPSPHRQEHPRVNWNPEIPGAPVEVALFALFALLALFGAVRVVTASDPFVSALSLLFNFVSLGALYLMLEQPFVAISQILVYAGAVVVLFLFVIAYLGDRRELVDDAVRSRGVRPFALLGAAAFGIVLVTVVLSATFPKTVELTETAAGFAFGTPRAIGESFLGTYVLAFEVTSLVLLVAAIGGIVLGLTGRARHDRLRKLMQTRSADQQKKLHEERERELRAARADNFGSTTMKGDA